MFNFDLSDKLKFKIKKLIKKYKKKVKIINKKIKQIIISDMDSINNYKNLRGDIKEFKRVHIDRSFILTFKVNLKKKFILFIDINHHDKVY